MKERLPPAPDPEMGTARPRKTHDLEYCSQGLQRADGVARLRIFECPALGVPLVLAMDLPQNTGPSITNLREYLA